MQFDEQLGFKTTAGIRAGIYAIDYYPFHAHKTYIEIICVLKGSYQIHDSAVTYNLSQHEVHIFNSTYPHKIVATEQGSVLLMIHIDKANYLEEHDNLIIGYYVADSPHKENILFPEMNLLRFYMAKVYTEYVRTSPSTIGLDSLANKIIELLFEQFHDYAYYKLQSGNYHVIRRKYDGRNEKEFYRIYEIADYVETHFHEKLKLTDIAELTFLSVPYLSKYIKENIGITFSELVSIVRCDEAERLLASTNMPVEHIASKIGFANRAHFFHILQSGFPNHRHNIEKTFSMT